MAEGRKGNGSYFWALLLIAIGGFFLYANFHPGWNPWQYFGRYWPVLLIVWGLGKIVDYIRWRQDPEGASASRICGGTVAGILTLVFVAGALFYAPRHNEFRHDSANVDGNGATSVEADLDMPEGELELSGGAAQLLEASFDYTESEGKPDVNYESSGTTGRLTIRQQGEHPHFGRTENHWQLRMKDGVPLEMRIKMGAGRGVLRTKGLDLTRLNVEMGAGELVADLTGDWKNSCEVTIQGGAGRAEVRLPESVGVEVRASGGLGSINPRGLKSRGGAYVNDALGKSPVTLRVNVQGGVGEIDLISVP